MSNNISKAIVEINAIFTKVESQLLKIEKPTEIQWSAVIHACTALGLDAYINEAFGINAMPRITSAVSENSQTIPDHTVMLYSTIELEPLGRHSVRGYTAYSIELYQSGGIALQQSEDAMDADLAWLERYQIYQ